MTPRISAIGLSLLLAGCVCAPSPHPASPPVVKSAPTPATAAQKKTSPPEVIHTARYTLINMETDDSLRFPLRQIVSHTLPATTARHILTREDALRRWLKGSGYGLCLAVTPAMKMFYASPLPDSQRRMGPVRTEQALQTIAGSAWVMTTDEISRTVCWQPSPASQSLS